MPAWRHTYSLHVRALPSLSYLQTSRYEEAFPPARTDKAVPASQAGGK